MFVMWFIVLCLHSSSAVIYHLNESEYQRMPPLYSLDEYEPCLAEEGGTYCVLQLHLHAEPGNQLMRLITEYSEHTIKHFNYSIIDRGVCVTKTCREYINGSETDQVLTGVLEPCLSESLERRYGVSARVAAVLYCDRRGDTPRVDAWDWAVLAAILCIVAVNVAATLVESGGHAIYKRQHSIEQGNTFLLSFSMIRNWKKLIQTETNNPRTQDLKFLNGIRVVLNLLTIYMHCIMSYTIGFSENVHDIEKAFEISWFRIFLHGPMVVQIFFFLSGFLAVYYLSVQEEKKGLDHLGYSKNYYTEVELVPALAVTLALATSWVRYAASGPLWNMFVTSSLVADCRNYWWRHLLFYNNYLDDSKFCLVPTWQLAAEMQVFVVCVSAYVLTVGRARRALLSGLLLLSAALPALLTWLWDLDAVFLTPQSFRTLDAGGPFFTQHSPGHTNLACFLLGMATAARLYHLQTQGKHHVQSGWYTAGQYLCIPAWRLVMNTTSFFYTDGPRASLAARVIFTFVIRPLMGLTCIFAFTSLFMKNPSFIKSIFEWRPWTVLSRLTYSVFLLHMILVQIAMGARPQQGYFSFYNVGSTFLWITVLSYLIAVPFSLMVEAPCIMLFKSLSRKHSPGAKTNGNTTDNGTSDGNTKKIL